MPIDFVDLITRLGLLTATQNHFQDKPEGYKQFLRILLAYQREQTPIHEVYSQLTNLFHTAPHLLEGFEQFLPRSAA